MSGLVLHKELATVQSSGAIFEQKSDYDKGDYDIKLHMQARARVGSERFLLTEWGKGGELSSYSARINHMFFGALLHLNVTNC